MDKERLKLMIKLASYEENQGKKDLRIMRRIKADYISYYSFTTCGFASIAVFIIFAADFGSKVIENLARFTDYDFVSDGIEYLTLWILIMAVYSFFSGRMYRKEYEEAEKRVNAYKRDLIRVGKMAKRNKTEDSSWNDY